jgi:hypothetical protein
MIRITSLLLILLFLLPPQIVFGGDSFEIDRKKYVRQPRDLFARRPRRVLPYDARKRVDPVRPSEKDKKRIPPPEIAGPAIKRPSEENRGPDIRVALATDTGTASVSSNLPISYYNFSEQTFEALAARQVKAQIAGGRVRERPGSTYRIQVASLRSSNDADSLARRLRQRFSEPVKVNFDRRASSYDVTVGEFSSQRDAQSFMVRVMNAGYKKPWVARDERESETREPMVSLLSDPGLER